jgi:hypothetical protein
MEEEIKTENPTWELKDRNYYLLNGKAPLTYTLPSKHTRRFPLLWFDNEKGSQKEIRYATNQESVFVEDQKGQCTMQHIVFKDGTLYVPKEKQALQKLLSIYHPHLGRRYAEINPQAIAIDALEDLNIEIDALNAARDLEVSHMEAILRVEEGSIVSKMSSKEIKRDCLLFAKRDPILFLTLLNDENVELRNFGIKAREAGIITLSQDQRTFKWGSNGRKLFTIPFDENPYSALAAWFKTDEGVEVYKTIDKKV